MALATTCPACSTSFKVNPEQLKLRRGLVRCGKCDHVFSGVEYLRYVSDSRTDEELNEDDGGGDRRKRDRRGTGRRLWGNTEPSATDELKTAFFLPDTEIGPSEAIDGNDADAQDKAGDQPNDEATKEAAGAQAAKAEDPAATDQQGRAAPADEASSSAEQSASEQAPTAKRSRRGGARGKRGRGRRKRATALAQSETNANETSEAEKQPPADAAQAPAGTAPKKSKSPKPPEQPGAVDQTAAPANTEDDAPAADAPATQAPAEPKPASPFPRKAQTRAGAVITSPLTQGARGDFQKSGRDDHWPSPPVWPKIDEHFDEPDIEEPDTSPGPAGTTEPALDQAKPSSVAASVGLADYDDPPADGAAESTNADTEAIGVTGLQKDNTQTALSGPPEEDAIDFFGKTSRPSFDFDLPPRRILIIAAGLIVLLFLQLAIGNRHVLASRFPAFSSGLAALSAPLGLDVQLPMNREEIKIASFDLTAASSREPDASYVMNLLMRNNAGYKLRWPAIELTLLDGVGGILVRKVLLPAEYLADESLLQRGLAGTSEHPIRVALKSSTDAPVGYSVSLFYP